MFPPALALEEGVPWGQTSRPPPVSPVGRTSCWNAGALTWGVDSWVLKQGFLTSQVPCSELSRVFTENKPTTEPQRGGPGGLESHSPTGGLAPSLADGRISSAVFVLWSLGLGSKKCKLGDRKAEKQASSELLPAPAQPVPETSGRAAQVPTASAAWVSPAP